MAAVHERPDLPNLNASNSPVPNVPSLDPSPARVHHYTSSLCRALARQQGFNALGMSWWLS
jgi:hypothetical protein